MRKTLLTHLDQTDPLWLVKQKARRQSLDPPVSIADMSWRGNKQNVGRYDIRYSLTGNRVQPVEEVYILQDSSSSRDSCYTKNSLFDTSLIHLRLDTVYTSEDRYLYRDINFLEEE